MEDWALGVLLALFVIVPCWLVFSRRQEIQRQVDTWREWARQTGLTYTPRYPTGLHGEYRGRSIAVTLISDSDRMDPPITSISLNFPNRANFSLSIQAKSLRDYLSTAAQLSSGNLEFDRRFRATGSPCEYLQAAVDRIVRSDAHLLRWIMRNFPSIELKGETLGFYQNSELTKVDDQLGLLDLLCDLAELTEKMGSSDIKEGEGEKNG